MTRTPAENAAVAQLPLSADEVAELKTTARRFAVATAPQIGSAAIA
jgi:hypothetical protein